MSLDIVVNGLPMGWEPDEEPTFSGNELTVPNPIFALWLAMGSRVLGHAIEIDGVPYSLADVDTWTPAPKVLRLERLHQ
jgi:hypothetical protein